MIVEEKEALARLGSPLNLINRLRTTSSKSRDAMGLFGIDKFNKSNNNGNNNNEKSINLPTSSFVNPFQKETALTTIETKQPSNSPPNPAEAPAEKAPNLDDLVGNADSQVKLGLAHDKALDLATRTLDMMRDKLDDIKPEKLSGVLSATSKVVDQIQRQRIETNKDKGSRSVHYHFYTPTQKVVEEYEVIDVG